MNKKKMHNPIYKVLLIAIIVAIIVFIVAPEVFDIFRDNINDVGGRANNA